MRTDQSTYDLSRLKGESKAKKEKEEVLSMVYSYGADCITQRLSY